MQVVIDNLDDFGRGLLATLSLLGLSGAGSMILGTLVAAMRISPVAVLRGFATVYVELVRNIPLLLVLFFCAFLLPVLGSDLPFYWYAVIGLTVYTSPFVAEAIRSGVNGVPVGQAEAARSVGLGFGQVLTLIVLPQAFRMTIPPLINVFIALTKNTSVAGGFGVFELFANTRQLIQLNGNAVIALLLGTAVCYLIVTVTLGVLAGFVERKVAVLR